MWLDPELTSPYAFYQFWLNADDADVVRYLKVFTFRSREEIEALEEAVARAARPPGRRSGRWRTTSRRSCTGRWRPTAWSRPARRCSAAVTCAPSTRRRLAAAVAELPSTTGRPGDPVVDLLAASGRRREQGRRPARDRRGRCVGQQRQGGRRRRGARRVRPAPRPVGAAAPGQAHPGGRRRRAGRAVVTRSRRGGVRPVACPRARDAHACERGDAPGGASAQVRRGDRHHGSRL